MQRRVPRQLKLDGIFSSFLPSRNQPTPGILCNQEWEILQI